MSDEHKDGDYEVGYSKPPKEHQFKKGQSGNPDGRPRKNKTASTDVAAILDEPITVKQGGVEREMGSFEASVHQLAARALKHRDLRAALEFIRLCDKYRVIMPAPQPSEGGVLVVPHGWTSQEWLDCYQRLGPPPWPGERSGVPDWPKDF